MSKNSGWLLGGVLIFLLIQGLAQAKGVPIEILVEVTEVNHRKAARLGIEWLDKVRLQEESMAGVVSLGSIVRDTLFRVDLNFLMENGAAEMLANPNLITDSGTTATFHAGGEIPYITSSTLGSTHVEFKPYGVELKVKPERLKNGAIRMKVRASVSAPDPTNGVVLSGNTVPALLEREVETNVTVDPGSTMTLAGLVQTSKENIRRGIPLLNRIPFLGIFFRWERKEFRKTTVVIFVTPKVIEL